MRPPSGALVARFQGVGPLLAAGCLLIASSGCSKGGGEPGKPEFTLQATELGKEFLQDSQAAISKYAGKVVALTGEVSQVLFFDGGKNVSVLLNAGHKGDNDIVGCQIQGFPEGNHKDLAVTLADGQKIEMTGRVKAGTSSMVTLDQPIAIREIGKSTLIHLSAEELAKEFTQDAQAAGGKFREKQVLLKGVVEETAKEGHLFRTKLKGDGKLLVSVTMESDDAGLLKKGQTIRVRAFFQVGGNSPGEVSLYKGELVEVR